MAIDREGVSDQTLKVTLVIYTLNELACLPTILPQIKEEWYDELLCIDGGSTDGTLEYLREKGYEVHVQTHPSWTGAYMEAYKRAKGDILVDFSPDGNSVPELIPKLVAEVRKGYDMVIASRYAKGAKSEDDTPISAFGNFLFTSLVNILFRGHYSDVMVMFRAYRKSLLRDCGLLNATLRHCPVTTQLCIRSAKIGARVTSIPGDEPKRIGGQPKVRVILDGLRNVKLILEELIFYDFKKRA